MPRVPMEGTGSPSPRPPSRVLPAPPALGDRVLRRVGEPIPDRLALALEVLCRSLRDDARLGPLAERPLAALIASGLIARRRLDALPPLPPAPAPVIVCGLPRSGTTVLHRLLARCARPVPLWELYAPGSPEEVREALGWLERAAPGLPHPVEADLPDECSVLLRLDLRSQLFWACAPVSGYLEWLLEEDPAPTYAMYGRALAALYASRPGRLTLKCPTHALHLPALLAAVPTARVVVTHRDPDAVVASSHRALGAVHASMTGRPPSGEVLSLNARRLALQAEETARTPDLACVHVAHRDIYADPVGVVRRVHEALGLEPIDEADLRAALAGMPGPSGAATPAPRAAGFDGYRERFAALLEPHGTG